MANYRAKLIKDEGGLYVWDIRPGNGKRMRYKTADAARNALELMFTAIEQGRVSIVDELTKVKK